MPSPTKQPNRESELHHVVENAPDLAASTKDRYLRDLNRWIDFAGADPSGWTKEQARAFYVSLSARMQPQSAARLFASVQYAAKRWSTALGRPGLNFAPTGHAYATDVATSTAIDTKRDEVRFVRAFVEVGINVTAGPHVIQVEILTQEFEVIDGPRKGQIVTLRTRANY
jgi:hypothetical protein